MNEMTLSSRHKIRNSSPGGLRPSTLLSVTEAPHNTDFHTWMGKKHLCFFQTAETGNRTLNSGVKGSGANHYPRAPVRSDHQRERKPLDGFGALIRIEHKKVTGFARIFFSPQKRHFKKVTTFHYYSFTKSKPFQN